MSNPGSRDFMAPFPSGEKLLDIPGAESGAMFGWSVAGAGDANGNGTPDILVGAGWADEVASNVGAAYRFSGATGTLLFAIHGTNSLGSMGNAMCSMGDIDSDGFFDFAISAFGEDVGGQSVGRVRVFSDKTPNVIRTLTGFQDVEDFGAAVAHAGDLDQDGMDDIAVGAPGEGLPNFAGRVYVLSTKSGHVIRHFDTLPGDELFGQTVTQVGDMNADGFEDLAVGAPLADTPFLTDAGRVYVFSFT